MKFLSVLFFLMLSFYNNAQTTLIRNVQIVDVEKGILIKNRDVLLDGNSIKWIGNTTKNIPLVTNFIDAAGRYLIPGLWDMHTHVWSAETAFPLLIANGVTGIRGMFETMQNVKKWRSTYASSAEPAPQLFVAGPIVDGPKPTWPGSVVIKTKEEAIRAVDSLKNKLKVDFIKVYSGLSEENYMAIAAESKKQHIVFAGHVPNEVTVVQAAKAGQKSQEHLNGFVELASDSADFIFNYIKGKVKDSNFTVRTNRKAFMFRTYNGKKLTAFLKEIKKTNTWICPTLTVLKGVASLKDTGLLNDPRMDYMGAYTRNSWDYRKDFRFKTMSDKDFEDMQKDYALKLTITKAIYKAGIPILAGTDFPNPHCYIGFGLHDELALLVKAGLSNIAALQTATINPAKYLGISNTEGSITVGKSANMVLLNRNPLEDIQNTKSIEMVFVKGKVYSKDALEQMLEKVKNLMAANPVPVNGAGYFHDD